MRGETQEHPVAAELIIRNLQPYEQGWQWDVETEHDYEDRRVTRSYRTDSSGCGLWVETWNRYGSYEGYRQVLGSSQFALSRVRSSARRQIRRHFTPAY